MKSKKEKETILLIFLILCIACYLFYSLLLSPKIAEANKLKSQVATDDNLIRSYYTSIKQYPQNAKRLSAAQTKAKEMSANFYVESQQENYLTDIDGMLKRSGENLDWLVIESKEHTWLEMITDGEYRSNSPYYAYMAKNVDGEKMMDILEDIQKVAQGLSNSKSEELKIPTTEQMTIKLNVTGQYENVKKLVSAIGQMDKHIVCNKLNMKVTPDESGSSNVASSVYNPYVAATMELQFVRLSDMLWKKNGENIPELPSGFVMPNEFVSGSYRKLFSFS